MRIRFEFHEEDGPSPSMIRRRRAMGKKKDRVNGWENSAGALIVMKK